MADNEPNRAVQMIGTIGVVGCLVFFGLLYILRIWGVIEGQEIFVKSAETVGVFVAMVVVGYLLLKAIKSKA